jgi:VanZ family protein
MAHFGIHLVLAILFYRALVLVCGGFKTSICLSLLFCGLVAFYDEYVQYYRPGRVFDLEDIALNLLGVSLGVILGILSVKQNE